MKFKADEEQTVVKGSYNYEAIENGGTITMMYKTSGGFNGVTNEVPGTGTIDVPTCTFKAGLTGAATLTLTRI